MGSRRAGTTTTVQKAEPWEGARPYLTRVYGEAQRLYDTVPQTPFFSLPVGERRAAAENVLGAPIPAVAGQFGLRPDYLTTAVDTGIAPLSPEERLARSAALAAGSAPLSPLYGGAEARTGAILNSPLGSAGATAGNYMEGVLAGRALPASLLASGARGDYLGSNPYLSDAVTAAARPVVEQFTERVLPAISAQFAAAGRYGSGAQTRAVRQASSALAGRLSDAATNVYARAYEAERSRQLAAQNALARVYGDAARGLLGAGAQEARIGLAASSMVPGVAAAGREAMLRRAAILEGIGEQQRRAAEAVAGRILGTYGEATAEPWRRLGMYADMIGGLPSSGLTVRSSEQPYYRNPGAGALGGALAGGLGGYGLATGVAALNPYMAPLVIGGALLGGALGAF